MASCRACGGAKSPTAATCPHCGARVRLDAPPERAAPSPGTSRPEASIPAAGRSGRALGSEERLWGKDPKHWLFLGAALLLLALGIYDFVALSALEAGERDSVTLNALSAAVYGLAGKWGLLALLATPAAVVVVTYARALSSSRRV
ncbi:MAG TPA: hypothetical protein RMH99_12830 [Sandaracinaceae bacterium LLY-WYZ-13_1]|nr:hypothetical protein [Sandaracinaceae bacterium LLY-WYZ-13_1]